MDEVNVEEINIEEWTDLIIAHGISLAVAGLIFFIGWMAAKFIRRTTRKLMEKSKLDSTLTSFLSNIIYGVVMAFVIIATLNEVGVQTASLIAVLGAAGLAIGLALQGSLSNFAAGIMIILFKHFKVGDYIEAAGVDGTVKNLDIFNTTLTTGNNQKIIIPNSNIISGAVINYSSNNTRRIDLVIGIGYDDDIKKAKKAIADVISKQKTILDSPESMIAVKNLGDSSVDLVVRAWVKNPDYWNTYFALLEEIKIRLDKEGISIPYPQTEIHLQQADA